MDAQTAMGLAATAYCADVRGALQKYLPSWTAVWVADAAINGNLAFIAYDGGTQYVVAIRGSLFSWTWSSFDNWFYQDLNVFEMVDWAYGGDGSAKIAQGASDGLSNLSSLVDSSGGSPVSILQFLLANALSPGKSITVTGHSLGGNLSTVLAPWLVYQIQSAGKAVPPMWIYTFAAPAAGNESFANAYDALFRGRSWRYMINLDIVPTFPVTISMFGMSAWYSPAPLASQISVTYEGLTVTLQEAINTVATAIAAAALSYDYSVYTQTNLTEGTEVLGTTLCDAWQSNTIEDWFDTVSCHHSPLTYCRSVGAPAVVCPMAPP